MTRSNTITTPDGWTVSHDPGRGIVEIVPCTIDEAGTEYEPGAAETIRRLAEQTLGGPARYVDAGEGGGEVWELCAGHEATGIWEAE